MSEPTFKGYFKKSPNTVHLADPELTAFMGKKLAAWGQLADYVKSAEAREEIANFANTPQFQPTTAFQLGTGFGVVNAPLIGDELLPTFIGGQNEQASYPVFGYEKFAADPDGNEIALAARPRRIDVQLDWRNVKVKVYTLEVATDRRELDQAVMLPISLGAYKLDVLRAQLNNEKEVAQADFVRYTNHYAAGFSGTPANKWDAALGTPIDDIFKAIAKMRKSKTRRKPDTFWMGDDVAVALSYNAQIKELVKYSGTKQDIGTGVSMEAIAALLRIPRIVVGSAGVTDIASNSPADVWGQDAGLLVTAPGEVMSARFGLTVGLAGYPVSDSYEEKQIGPKGGTVDKYSLAYNLELTTPKGETKSTAGYLFTSASNDL